MASSNLNPQAEAKSDIVTTPQSDSGAATLEQRSAVPGKRLITLVDGDGLNRALTAILGRRPKQHERPDQVRWMNWMQETANHISANLWTPQWFYDSSKLMKIYEFLEVLRKAGWAPRAVRGGRNPGSRHLGLAIEHWGRTGGDNPLLVGIPYQDVWEQLEAARLERPDPWVGVVGYEGLIPDARDNELGIEFFDLERDVEAHPAPLTRVFDGPEPFDPSQIFGDA